MFIHLRSKIHLLRICHSSYWDLKDQLNRQISGLYWFWMCMNTSINKDWTIWLTKWDTCRQQLQNVEWKVFIESKKACGKNNYLRGTGGEAKGILYFKQQESSKTLLLISCRYQTEGSQLEWKFQQYSGNTAKTREEFIKLPFTGKYKRSVERLQMPECSVMQELSN